MNIDIENTKIKENKNEEKENKWLELE
jgi:hypothetical protein